MNTKLRITQAQHLALSHHLFPGDGREAVALLLGGRREDGEGLRLEQEYIRFGWINKRLQYLIENRLA